MNQRNIQLLILIGTVAMLFSACQKAPFVKMTGPRSYNFTRDGGSQTVAFSCNRDWKVSSSESWITVSPASGKGGDGTVSVSVTCAPNTTYDARSATITIRVESLTETISVTQDTGIGLLVLPDSFDLSNAAQAIEIAVQKNVPYTVSIDNAGATWIKQGDTKALTTDKVTFRIDSNTSYDKREGRITFTQQGGTLTQTVTVRQDQTDALIIDTPEFEVSNKKQTLEVEVDANVGFEVSSQSEWIKYVQTKALKASTVTLDIAANETSTNRIGTVLVKQTNGGLEGTITVRQAGQTSLTAVDLGLSVKWADRNLGAGAPEEYGDYYAWGEIEAKEEYLLANYKWYDSVNQGLLKYNTMNGSGVVDNDTTLDPEDDAAHIMMGGNWRMPTDGEWSELFANCVWTWTALYGVNGYLVTSNKNGNSIFLPAAGLRSDGADSDNEWGYYWSSTLYTGHTYRARNINFNQSRKKEGFQLRYMGQPVRAVLK